MGQALQPVQLQGLPLARLQGIYGCLRDRQQLRIHHLLFRGYGPVAGQPVTHLANFGSHVPAPSIARFQIVAREVAQDREQ